VGALIFYPIILNIFIITLSLNMAGTPAITFLMLLANTWLLLWDYDKLKYIFVNPQKSMPEVQLVKRGNNYPMWIFGILGLTLFFTSLFFQLWLKNPLFWSVSCFVELAVGLVVFFIIQKKSGQFGF